MKRDAALYALLAAWLLPGLFGHDPWKPDEAYTFGLVYHILESGDWLVPTLAGVPFVEKPPLFFWTAAVFSHAFGWLMPVHDAARLATAFYTALTLIFVSLTARRLYGPSTALPAALLLAACLGYLQHAHQLITDTALLAGIEDPEVRSASERFVPRPVPVERDHQRPVTRGDTHRHAASIPRAKNRRNWRN